MSTDSAKHTPGPAEETLKERAATFLLEQILSKPGAPGFWTDFHDEVTTLLADFACIVALPIIRERIEFMNALKAAEEAIVALTDQQLIDNQPLMGAVIQIRAALSKAAKAEEKP
jgi:hypothetical protein